MSSRQLRPAEKPIAASSRQPPKPPTVSANFKQKAQRSAIPLSKPRISNPRPTPEQISKSISAMKKGFTRRAGPPYPEPHNDGQGKPKYPDEFQSVEEEIKYVLRTCPSSDGPEGYLSVLRYGIVRLCMAALDYETGTFEGVFDADIREICRVIDELVRTSECFIGGETIRPSTTLARKWLEEGFHK